ncbi:MAG: MarR family transcriptional regulator [Streptococcaceae bacterium]|jgi:Mn-dependent DtxR family transcriptional regulator|nr:MarR family transcriptional regulator [Streptococcaceae bacterium]
MELKDQVLEVFEKSDKMLDAKTVAAALNVEKPEVSKVISKLKKEGVLVSPKVCFYELAAK